MRTPDLSKLNEAQRSAVLWTGGPLLLLAGPGSGKTTVIVNRILHLLSLGVPPDSILVITFTKEAAVSMQERFRAQAETFYPVNFGTFHSVFYQIIRSADPAKTLQIISATQKKAILIPILKQYQREENSDPEQTEEISALLNAISLYKNTDDMELTLTKVPVQYRECFEPIFQKYREAVYRRNGIDFDDMLYECRKLLSENETLRTKWNHRFRHILIDEFQDINPMQYEIVRLLSEATQSVFAVGDDDQSIYGFRGSRPELMMRFEKEYHADRMLLNVNYRCESRIVGSSLKVIEENKKRFSKDLIAARKGEEQSFAVKAFADRKEQAQYLCNTLKAFRNQFPDGSQSLAVLFRTNAYMQGTAVRLTAAGIPYSMKETVRSIYEHFIVKDIMAYLLLASGVWKREYILRIMNRPVRYLTREAAAESSSVREMIQYYQKTAKGNEPCHSQIAALEKLQTNLIQLGKMKPSFGINYILKAICYDRYLKCQSAAKPELAQEWNELILWLKEDAAKYDDVQTWLDAQFMYEEKLKAEKSRKPDDREPIKLMTIHAAKGLEFHTVLIPDCNEKVYPHGRDKEGDSLEEERRIFYVGMTRAKERLELIYLYGSKGKPMFPSRFIKPWIR